MKKVVGVVLCFTMMICMAVPVLGCSRDGTQGNSKEIAYKVEGGNIYFQPDTQTITRSDQGVTVVNIPASIDGTAVKKIGKNAFCDHEKLAKVTLPEGLEVIEDGAFCKTEDISLEIRLKEIKLPSTLKKIGSSAFSDSDFKTLKLPDNLEYIGDHAFFNNQNLSGTLVIPDRVTYLGAHAFEQCGWSEHGVSKIVVGKGVTEIKESTFSGFQAVKEVILPDTITKIGANAFYDAGKLKTIKLPGNLTEIGNYAFIDSGLEKLILPKKLKTIGKYAFQWTKIKSLKIPDSVTSIGKQAFAGCSSLKKATLSTKMKKLDQKVFWNDKKLQTLIVPKQIKSVEPDAIRDCKKLKYLTISYKKGKKTVYAKTSILKAPTNFKVKKKGKKQAVVTWKKAKGAAGYKIYSGSRLIKTVKKQTYTVKDRTKYSNRYKVAAYKKVKGVTIYSEFRSAKY